MKCPRCHSPRVFPDYSREKVPWRDQWLYPYVCHWCGHKFEDEELLTPGAQPSYKAEGLRGVLRLRVPDAKKDKPRLSGPQASPDEQGDVARHMGREEEEIWRRMERDLAESSAAKRRGTPLLKKVLAVLLVALLVFALLWMSTAQ